MYLYGQIFSPVESNEPQNLAATLGSEEPPHATYMKSLKIIKTKSIIVVAMSRKNVVIV